MRIIFLILLCLVSLPAMAQNSITSVGPTPSAGQVILLNNNGYIQPGQGMAYNAGRVAGFVADGGLPQNNVIVTGSGEGATLNNNEINNALQNGNGGVQIYNGNQLSGTYANGQYKPAR